MSIAERIRGRLPVWKTAAGAPKKTLGRRLLDAGLAVFAVTVVTVFSIMSPYFLTLGNWVNILISVCIIGIVGVAMTLVIVSGGIDLSAASTMALVGSVEAVLVMQSGWPWWQALLVGLLVGLVVGSLNALVITRLKIAPFIVTLAMSNIVRGAAYIYTTGNTIFVQSPACWDFPSQCSLCWSLISACGLCCATRCLGATCTLWAATKSPAACFCC